MTEVKEFTDAEIAQKLSEEQREIMTTIHAYTPQGVINRLVAISKKVNEEEA